MSCRAVLLLVLALSGCRERGLTALSADLTVPSELDFGVVYVGHARTQPLVLSNRGRAPVDFHITATAPFTAPESLRLPGGATVLLDVALLAEVEGPLAGTLRLEADGLAFGVELRGVGALVPTCVPSNDCVDSSFDPTSGCVESPSAEGASCGANDRCVSGGHCQQGVCVGQAVSCDDGDACTADACNPKQGCIHPPVQCAQPSGACEVAVCEPATGCAVRPAIDGARCGANDCQTAQVCISGACVERPAPDGSECGAPSTCRGPGSCHAGACAPAPAHVPTPRWRYTPPIELNVMNVTVDVHGNTFALVGTTMLEELDGGPPPAYPIWLFSFDLDGNRRFAVNLSLDTPGIERGMSLMADPDSDVVYLAARTYKYGTSVQQRVAVLHARSASTGALLWQYDLHQGIPILNSGTGQMSLELNRMMLLSPGVLAVALVEGDSLHQSYVVGISTQTGTQLWKVNRGGHMVVGASGNGDVWEASAACWATETFSSRINATGGTVGQRLLSVSMLAFDRDRALVRAQSRQLGWLSSSLVVTPIVLPAQYEPSWSSLARLEGPLLTYVSEDAQAQPALTRYDSASDAVQWSVPLRASSASQLWLLRDGGAAASIWAGDGGTELVTFGANGAEVERCPYGTAYGVTVTNNLYVTRDGASIVAFDVPGREAATSGWTGPDGFAGTGRPR